MCYFSLYIYELQQDTFKFQLVRHSVILNTLHSEIYEFDNIVEKIMNSQKSGLIFNYTQTMWLSKETKRPPILLLKYSKETKLISRGKYVPVSHFIAVNP